MSFWKYPIFLKKTEILIQSRFTNYQVFYKMLDSNETIILVLISYFYSKLSIESVLSSSLQTILVEKITFLSA